MNAIWRSFGGNVCHLLLDAAARDEGAPAVVETGATICYGELAARAAAIAQTLRDLRVRPGDRVGVFLMRGVDAAAAHFGVLHAGGVVVPVNESLRPRQIEHILVDAAVTLLLTRVSPAAAQGPRYRWPRQRRAGTRRCHSRKADSRISSRPASASRRARTPNGTVTTSCPWPIRRPWTVGMPSGAISSSISFSTVRL